MKYNKEENSFHTSQSSKDNSTHSSRYTDVSKQKSSDCRVTYSQFMANGKPVQTKEDKYRNEPVCSVKITLKNYTDNKKVMKEILERSNYVLRSYLKKNYLSIKDESLFDSTTTDITCQFPFTKSKSQSSSRSTSTSTSTSSQTTSSNKMTSLNPTTLKTSDSSVYYNDGNRDAMIGIKKIQKSKYSNLFIGTLTPEEAESQTTEQNTFRIYCRILDEKCNTINKSGWLQIYIVYKNLTNNYIHIPVVSVINEAGVEGLTFYNFNNSEKYFKDYNELIDFLKEIINDRPSILVAKYGKVQDKGCIPKINRNGSSLKTSEPTFYNYYIGVKHEDEAEGYLHGPLDFKLYHRLLSKKSCLNCSNPSPQLYIIYQCHSGQVIHLPIVSRRKDHSDIKYAIYQFDGISPVFDNLNCITSYLFKSIVNFKRRSRRRINNDTRK
uniref:SH2 domain-containing protein n=1 Tax=Strongyloides stercoralis TaxID=6248 RepID=A0A0K0E521_STRER